MTADRNGPALWRDRTGELRARAQEILLQTGDWRGVDSDPTLAIDHDEDDG